jgi:hypothetical protein
MAEFIAQLPDILKEAAWGSLSSVWTMARIVIPLMVVIEVAKELHLVERLVRFLRPAMRFLGLSPRAAFPLLVGVFFGLAYGAGLLIDFAREGELNADENYLLNVFLNICHAMIEDPLLFFAIGASYPVMILTRVGAAIVVTRVFAWVLGRPAAKQGEGV